MNNNKLDRDYSNLKKFNDEIQKEVKENTPEKDSNKSQEVKTPPVEVKEDK